MSKATTQIKTILEQGAKDYWLNACLKRWVFKSRLENFEGGGLGDFKG